MEKLSEQLNGLAAEFVKMAEDSDLDDKDIYTCPICRDCGWIIEGTSARPCICQIREESNERRLPIPHLQQMLFSNFDLKLYPVRLFQLPWRLLILWPRGSIGRG